MSDRQNSSRYGCPVEATLEVVSGKWKSVILWWLRRGEKRFSELMLLIPAIARKVLTEQLRELESDGLIRREAYQEKPPRVEYFLTPKGQSLQPLLKLMCDWGKEQLPGFEFGVLKLSKLKVLAFTARESTDKALRNVLAESCGAELILQSRDTPLELVIETFVRLEPDITIVEFTPELEDFSSLVRQIRQLEREQDRAFYSICLTHDPIERRRAFTQGFRMTFSNPFEPDELVGGIAGLTGRLHQETPS